MHYLPPSTHQDEHQHAVAKVCPTWLIVHLSKLVFVFYLLIQVVWDIYVRYGCIISYVITHLQTFMLIPLIFIHKPFLGYYSFQFQSLSNKSSSSFQPLISIIIDFQFLENPLIFISFIFFNLFPHQNHPNLAILLNFCLCFSSISSLMTLNSPVNYWYYVKYPQINLKIMISIPNQL